MLFAARRKTTTTRCTKVCVWRASDIQRCLLFGRDGVNSGRGRIGQKWTRMTQCMVRPCVAREFRRVGGSGLASMYPAFGWSISLLAIMGISAPVISLAERPRGPFGSPVFASAGKTEPPSRLVLSQTSVGLAGASYAGSMTTRPEACSPRSPGREPVHSRRCERACWQARSPARCGAAASWPPRSRL